MSRSCHAVTQAVTVKGRGIKAVTLSRLLHSPA